MNRKLVLMLTLTLLVGILSVAFNVQRAKASGTIYIRADGSIDPPDAPTATVDYVTYTLTANVTSDANGIVVERDNIVIDGAGYKVQGSGTIGIDLSERENVTVRNTRINAFSYGIYLWRSSNNSMVGNNIANSEQASIYFLASSNNDSIVGNNIASNGNGMYLDSSSYNSISGNNITNNGYCIYFSYLTDYNKFYHNNFMNNTLQVEFHPQSGYTNFCDNEYPSGGNFWSDYNGTDANHDGIGDTPYLIDSNNTDRYPLMSEYVIPEFPHSSFYPYSS